MKKSPLKKEVQDPSLPPIPAKRPMMGGAIFNTLKGYGNHDKLKVDVQSILDTDGELPAAEYSDLHKYLTSKRTDYLNGSKEEKSLIKRDLNMKGDVVAYKNFRQDLAAAVNTKAIMNGYIKSSQGQAVVGLLGNESRLVQKDCGDDPNCPDKGKLGVVLPSLPAAKTAQIELEKLYGRNQTSTSTKSLYDQSEPGEAEDNWMDVAMDQPDWSEEDLRLEKNLQRIIDNNKERWVSVANLKNQIKLKDSGTIDVLTTMGNNQLNQSTKVSWSDGVEFNESAAARQIKANVIGKANNFESLIYDEMISGRTFYDDVLERVKGQTYASLGMANQMMQEEDEQDQMNLGIEKMDMSIEAAVQTLQYMPGVNPDDGISEEEARIITDEMVNNPVYKDILDKEMVDYFVGYLRNQWKMGEKNRPAPPEPPKDSNEVNTDYL